MLGRTAEATAPCRVDLAGGTLDVWPVYLFHPRAVAVSVAIDRRAWCRVETGGSGVRIESKDTLQKVEGRDVAEVLRGGVLPLVGHVLLALRIESEVAVTTQSRVPAGSGLGGRSALAVAVAAAAARATGRELESGRLLRLVRDAEAACLGIPVGVQDHHAALQGGVLALHLEPGEARVERVQTDPGRVEESLLLVDAGASREAAGGSWDVLKAQIDGTIPGRDALAAIASAAGRVREALLASRYDDVGPLLVEEWEARKRLFPGVTTPEIDRVVEVAREAGGAAKACGAGGVVAVWAPPGAREAGRREKVQAAVTAAGFRVFPVRVDLLGLEVE
jgi:D-glycero-alpha-D-manno-heptose-7-phosphate kinase